MDTILPLLILAISAYFIARFFRRRDAEYVVTPDHDAEDWSQTVPPSWNPPLEFYKVNIGQQFTIDRDPNKCVFEKIKSTPAGYNARCDLYDGFIEDTDIVRLVTTPAWKN